MALEPAATASSGNKNSLGPVPDLLNHKLWGQDPKICVSTSFPGDSYVLFKFENHQARSSVKYRNSFKHLKPPQGPYLHKNVGGGGCSFLSNSLK